MGEFLKNLLAILEIFFLFILYGFRVDSHKNMYLFYCKYCTLLKLQVFGAVCIHCGTLWVFYNFSPSYPYHKDERTLPGNLQSRKISIPTPPPPHGICSVSLFPLSFAFHFSSVSVYTCRKIQILYFLGVGGLLLE
jgi:hypothetical protein